MAKAKTALLPAQVSPPAEVAQPMELFDEASLPVREDLVEMVQARSFLPEKRPDSARFSGKITLKRMLNNEEHCEQVCTAIAVGLSVRLIAKRFQLSPHSVVRIRQAMEERGELEAVGKRIRQKLDRFIELGLERMVEGVVNGEIHPGQLPIAVLAGIDKKGQLDAGVVPGTSVLVGEAEGAQIRAYFEALKRAREAATEVQSTGSAAQVIDAVRVPASELVLDTPLATSDAPLATSSDAGQTPAGGALGVVPGPSREGPGGGIVSAAPVAIPNALVQNSGTSKEPLS